MAEYSDILKQVDSSLGAFDSAALKAQKKLMEQVQLLSKDLETDSQGNIKTTIANLQKIAKIKAAIAKIVCDDQYKDSVTKLCEDFEKVYKKQQAFYKTTFQAGTIGETAAKKQKLLQQLAVSNTIEGLTGSGLNAQITDKLSEMLQRSVTSGAKWTDMVGEMKAYLDPDGDGTGAFAKYAKTYATTAMGQFTGQNNKLMTDALDTEWYMYVGSEIETTREFCQHLTKKKYIHVSEIPTILAGHIDDHDCEIYAKTGLPKGMIEGTTPENFQVNVGGWNCRHQLLPVAEEAVPANIRQKFEAMKQEQIQKQKEEEAKKKAEEEMIQKKEEVSALLEQFKDYPFAHYENAMKMVESGDLAGMEMIQSQIQSAKEQIAGLKHVPNAMELAKELDIMQLHMLNATFMDYMTEIKSMTDPDDKIDFLTELKAVITDNKLKPYKEAFIADQLDLAYKEKAVYGIEQSYKEVKLYADSHPKSKKIIDLCEAAATDMVNGDYDSANKNLVAAKKQIQSNKSSEAAKAKKQSAPKEEPKPQPKQFANFMATAEEMELFSELDLMNADAAITAKINALSGLPLESQKKKLLFEISWVEQNKKYPTWKIAQKAYAKKLEEVIYQIDIKPIVSKYTSLVAQNAGNADVVELLKGLNSSIKAGKPISELQTEIADIEKVINKSQEEAAKKAAEESAKRLASIKKSKSIIEEKDLNVALNDKGFWDAVKYTIDKGKSSSKLKKAEKEEIIQKLQDARDSKNIPLANECLKKLGYDPNDAYGEWRRDIVRKYFKQPQEANDHYYYSAEEYYKIATEEGKTAFAGYTAGSAYITETLRSIDGWHYKVPSWKSIDKEMIERDILHMTSELDKCSFRDDMWIKRDAASWQIEYIFKIPSLANYRNNPSALVGMVGMDDSFMSCGSCKNTRFTCTENKDVVYNLYVPSGSKGVYAHPFSACGAYGKGWDGKAKCSVDSHKENEIILQRGTMMRIRKAEYDAGKRMWYIDLDVIGQNPRDFKVLKDQYGGFYCEYE